ncbi:MAG: LPS export ABC transporter periplasmic protein LptC [Cytophagales bacterium]|nr:LPS export ABC transporter periplasmic protein LptC [Cytophagales bacterium]
MKEDLQIKFSHPRHTKTVIANYGRFFVICLFAFSCDSKQELLNQKDYEGPMMRLDSVNRLVTDSAKILLRLQALVEEVYENNNQEWKEGLFLQYYDNFGEVSSTFKSNYAFYDKKQNLYKGVGDVIVTNATTGDELNTEELFWDPQKKEFYTERFVTIHTEDEIHTGEGLTANEDFSSYKILKPAGTFTIDETTTPLPQ